MFEDWLKSRKASTTNPMGRAITTASVIGLHMVVAIFLGFGFGYFLDKFFNTAPWLAIVFLLLGIIAGFKNLISQGKRLLAFHDQMDEERRAEEIAANLKALQNEDTEKPGQAGSSLQQSDNGDAGKKS